MKEPHTELFVAPTGVGKIHLTLDLLKKYNKTYQLRNWIWTDPASYVFLIEPSDHLYDWVEKMVKLFAGFKTLFLIDDIITNENLKKRQPLLELAISGRHKEHSLWLLMQSYTAVPKILEDKKKCFKFGIQKTEQI